MAKTHPMRNPQRQVVGNTHLEQWTIVWTWLLLLVSVLLLVFASQLHLTRPVAAQSFVNGKNSSNEKTPTSSCSKHSSGAMDNSLDLAAPPGLCIVARFCLTAAFDAPYSRAKLCQWQKLIQ
jgi:hypothetical protein